jgi:hypothetical protein
MQHELKTWPKPFQAVLDGVKPYEIRRNDRPFAVGDTLLLREWDPEAGFYTGGDYTGRAAIRRVTYISGPSEWGLPADLVVMGISRENTVA